jgi:hypothetical protein
MLKNLDVKIEGVSPLLMHSPQTMEPGHPIGLAIKEITCLRSKTVEQQKELFRLEWLAGLYVNEKGKAILPGSMLEASLVAGAKKARLGKQFLSGVFVEDDPELDFPDSKIKAEKLWEKGGYKLSVPARVQQARVMRTRPMFKQWSLRFKVTFNDDVVDKKQVIDALKTAGQLCGVGDWRPKFGRYEVKSAK